MAVAMSDPTREMGLAPWWNTFFERCIVIYMYIIHMLTVYDFIIIYIYIYNKNESYNITKPRIQSRQRRESTTATVYMLVFFSPVVSVVLGVDGVIFRINKDGLTACCNSLVNG